MPKQATLRTSREMGITFVPYARFQVQTRLAPKECAARLRAVTLPQKLTTLFCAAMMTLSTSFQAYRIKNALRQLLSTPLSDAREGGELLF